MASPTLFITDKSPWNTHGPSGGNSWRKSVWFAGRCRARAWLRVCSCAAGPLPRAVQPRRHGQELACRRASELWTGLGQTQLLPGPRIRECAARVQGAVETSDDY
jgi:hypothetical protein